MIAQLRLVDDNWRGTWRTGRLRVEPGELVIVNCAGGIRMAKVVAVGRTRKAVGSSFSGKLKSVKRRANMDEIVAYARVEAAKQLAKDARISASYAKLALNDLIRRS